MYQVKRLILATVLQFIDQNKYGKYRIAYNIDPNEQGVPKLGQ
jgi:hypothetical protein